MTLKPKEEFWKELCDEAKENLAGEKALGLLLSECFLNSKSLDDALSVRLAHKLSRRSIPYENLKALFDEAFLDNAQIAERAQCDLSAIFDRDPACKQYIFPLLYFKGFHALTAYRIAHHFWEKDRQALALYLQSLISEVFAVDIHPAARIGKGVLLDHATSVVIGETAVVEDDVSILHEVTLGGTGKEHGDRHPKIRSGVLIGAGAKILGNIEIGRCAKIGAGSVVLSDVPPHMTAIGVPAKIFSACPESRPALDMKHDLEADTDGGV